MDIPVLIIGGGPVGLCASIALSRFGVPSLLVERHAATSAFPKGRALSIRTMEVLRRSALEQDEQGVTAWLREADGQMSTIRAAYAIDPDGAVLIRPDDHVAWRCPRLPERPEQAVAQALATALSRRRDRSPR